MIYKIVFVKPFLTLVLWSYVLDNGKKKILSKLYVYCALLTIFVLKLIFLQCLIICVARFYYHEEKYEIFFFCLSLFAQLCHRVFFAIFGWYRTFWAKKTNIFFLFQRVYNVEKYFAFSFKHDVLSMKWLFLEIGYMKGTNI